MTEFVVESVLQNLNSLIQKELRPFLSFHQHLRRLADMFRTMKASLEDAEGKQFLDTDINNWLRKVNDVAHMVDEIIDECNYEAVGLEYLGVKGDLSDKVQCSCLSSFHPKHVVFVYRIVRKMKRISERLIEIVKEKNNFDLTEREMIVGRRNEVIQGRQTTSLLPKVYGRESEVRRLLEYCLADDSFLPYYGSEMDFGVFPIEGNEGIGKTTIAKFIFDLPIIVNHFELRIWVRSSTDFSFKRMIEAILKAAIRCDCEDLDLELVEKKLQHLLQGKRYLLVLDFQLYPATQSWDTFLDNWQRLKSVLACGKKGASLLITCPYGAGADKISTGPHFYLYRLSNDDCWKLFEQQVFEPNEEKPSELVVIGKVIVQKCEGMPLAAKALGGLLHFSREEKQWLNVMESNIWALGIPLFETPVKPALMLSYSNLPTRLKKCFAYCAIFPKDERIEKQYLIELWMANGFISSDGRLDAEDVGDDVWNELYRRSLFQDTETNEFDNITFFRMHNRVLDIAILVAKDVKCLLDDDTIPYWSNRIHHLCQRRRNALDSYELQQVKSLRTYLIPNKYTDQLSPNVFKCNSLRVLELRLRGDLSPSVGDLKHLRYLNLCKSDFKTLPEYLCKLWNLQILKLDYCKYLQKLPNNLIDLRSLEKLSFKGCHKLSSLPPQMGKLISLRSLSSFFVGNERGSLLAELGGMRLKGDLEMKNLGRVKSVEDAMEANMSSKRLKELRLSWERNEETKLGEKAEEILEALQPDTQQLVSLTVTGYTGAHFPGWVFTPSLKKLQIERCRELKGLHEALTAMTGLQWLRLYDLPNLESLPDCFQHFSSLRQLAVGFCGKLRSLPNSLRRKRLERLDIYGCPALENQLCGWSILDEYSEYRIDGCLIQGGEVVQPFQNQV